MTTTDKVQNSAVINPYALAELVAGRRIAWNEIADSRRVLESLLRTPYEELFDPRFDSPLYIGFRLNADLELEKVQPSLPDLEPDNARNDSELPIDDTDDVIRHLGDLKRLFAEDLAGIPVSRYEMLPNGSIRLQLSAPGATRQQDMAMVLTPNIIEIITSILATLTPRDFNPPNTTWGDSGRFFNEAAEFFDPIQGAVANCYLIAAMASVAWARPFMITHMTRGTGSGQQEFTNMIRFRDIDAGNAVREVEVTDAIVLNNATNAPIYCRSSEAGEIWPAIYEKAFAKWKTGTPGDRPDITATAWGDCVRAAAELTGLPRHYYSTANLSGDELWTKVRENSLGGRTFNPMVAATYSSGDAAPGKVVYADANLVASHCYSVLGWDYRDGQKYIILRNPWGQTEASIDVLSGTTVVYDVSWWRPIVLANPDGVFALGANTFKRYFSLLGAVK